MSRAEVLEILRGSDPVCVCAHASPDGDALGSLLGLGPSLAATGRDVVLYQDGDEPFPRELAFLGLERIARRVPADAVRRTLIALDCGSALRIDRRGQVAGQFARVVNIDHHHDNTLFGAVNLVDPRPRARPRSSPACWTRRASHWPRARHSRSTSASSPTPDDFNTPTPRRARIGSQRGSCRREWSRRPCPQRSSSRSRSRGSACSGLALGGGGCRRRATRDDMARARRLRGDGRGRCGVRRRRGRAEGDRGRGARGARARAARSHRAGAQGLAALPRRRRRQLGDRARARRRRASRRGRLSTDETVGEIRTFLERAVGA